MLKKIIDFFTGKKPEPVEPVDTWKPMATAPYKVPEPAATTPIPLVVANSNPAPIAAEPAQPEKKKRTFAKKPAAPKAAAKPVSKPAAIKAPAKPRAKKTPQ